MAKRKNPLKDLDAFLKQEAKNIVQPKKVGVKPQQKLKTEPEEKPQQTKPSPVIIDNVAVQQFLTKLKKSGNPEFYELILKSVEEAGLDSSENKMLVNTFLYLKGKDNWKETIKEYWS